MFDMVVDSLVWEQWQVLQSFSGSLGSMASDTSTSQYVALPYIWWGKYHLQVWPLAANSGPCLESAASQHFYLSFKTNIDFSVTAS